MLRNKTSDRRLVEGWIEGPCAEAADLRGINNIMLDFYDDPQFVHTLLEFVVEMEGSHNPHWYQPEAFVDFLLAVIED